MSALATRRVIQTPPSLSSSSVSATPLLDDFGNVQFTSHSNSRSPQHAASRKRKRGHVHPQTWQKGQSDSSPSHFRVPLEESFDTYHMKEPVVPASALSLEHDLLHSTQTPMHGVMPPESFQRSTGQMPTLASAQGPSCSTRRNGHLSGHDQTRYMNSSDFEGESMANQHYHNDHRNMFKSSSSQPMMCPGNKSGYDWPDMLGSPSFDGNLDTTLNVTYDSHDLYAIGKSHDAPTMLQAWSDNSMLVDDSCMAHGGSTFGHNYNGHSVPTTSGHQFDLHTQAIKPSASVYPYCDGSLPCAEIDPHCELPCDQECKDEGCESCDESPICCEPCPDPQRCASTECDDATCLEAPNSSACVGKLASVCCSSRASPVPFDKKFVDPKVLELPCHWQRSDGSICDVSLRSREELSSHIHEQHIQPQGQMSCQWDSCMDTFPANDFEEHVLQSHLSQSNAGMNSCLWNGCGGSFEWKHLGQHLPSPPPTSTYNCHWNGCGEAMAGERALKEHVDTDHLVEPPPEDSDSRSSPIDAQELEASLEGLSADDKESSRTYIQKVLKMCPRKPRAGQYTCEWLSSTGQACGAIYTDANDLQNHVDTIHMYDFKQNKGLDLICQWQGCTRQFKFNERSKLARHLYTHTHYTMSTCCFCDHDFNNQTQLVNHVRGHLKHTHFSCAKCSYVTTNKAALKTHERTHTQAKPLKCEICDYCCGDPSNMSKHRNTHREPRHKCPNCGKAFCRPGTMKRHLGTCGKSADEKARRRVGAAEGRKGSVSKVLKGRI